MLNAQFSMFSEGAGNVQSIAADQFRITDSYELITVYCLLFTIYWLLFTDYCVYANYFQTLL